MLAFWEAFDERRPIGCEWEMLAQIMGQLDAQITATLNPNLKEKDRIQPRSWLSFLPKALQPNRDKKSSRKIDKQLGDIARAFGGSYGDND